ncbi:MAG TPA: hypothetical protein VGC07_09000 [Granulicella sp.]
MLEPFRSDFNARFTPEKYERLLTQLQTATRSKVEFRVCETPCFFPQELIDRMVEAGAAMTHQLVDDPAYMAAAALEVPEKYRVPQPSPHPHFMTVDFGLIRNEQGELEPKLVELQAFPSIFGFQDELTQAYIEIYELDSSLTCLLGGLDRKRYWELLGRVILAGHAPENVVLAEVEPEKQKTLPDFHVHEDRLGIRVVDIAAIRREGRRLFYQNDGRWVPIHRIYNRAIVDEMERKGIAPGFDYREDLDVEWAGNPNWYFQISKFSLPYLRHPAVPKTVFLDEWIEQGSKNGLPEDRERLLLKPLYSFSGRGIQFAPTDADLAAIPPGDRRKYLIQERMSFDPVIATPFGGTQAEVRMLYLWPDGGELTPASCLVRMGRGLMMGVDHNRDQKWVGGAAGFAIRK